MPEHANDTRSRIVTATVELMREDPNVRPSVRNVATRAGVGPSTLRHYFPTQASLIAAALTRLYEEEMPDDRMLDESIPARERLLDALRTLLVSFSTPEASREVWKTLYEQFMSPEATDDARQGFLFIARQAESRVESWLAILVSQGALTEGDNVRRMKFLFTVVDGISVQRGLPAEADAQAYENATLESAVDWVFADRG